MKHIIIIGDGMAGRPLNELGGKTPLQAAKKPNMDRIASNGRNGLLNNVPEGMPADSDVAIMSILGYNPRKYYTGRGPLEALGMDVELDENEVAFRCNLITEENGKVKDYSAGHISTEEARELIEEVSSKRGNLGEFNVGIDYRHLFVLQEEENEIGELDSAAPHKIIGESYEENLIKPRNNETAQYLNKIILDSREILSNHPVNKKRAEEGKNPANSIWLWGQGKKPKMKTVQEKYGIGGAVISAVTLVKGLGVCAGMDKVSVPGATGYYDTSYENKADFGLKSLEDHDLVFIHVEAPDEAGHAGDVEKKIEAIENLDNRLLGNVIDNVDGEYTVSIMADHPTPIEVKNHVPDPVPFSIYSTEKEGDEVNCFEEFSAQKGSIGEIEGYKFLDNLLLDN